MPVFDFTCTICKKDFEELVLVKDKEVLCPFCTSNKVRKLFSTSPPNFRLQGSGWSGSKIIPIKSSDKQRID